MKIFMVDIFNSGILQVVVIKCASLPNYLHQYSLHVFIVEIWLLYKRRSSYVNI